MSMPKVEINRAPVLTLWATVVAERLGYGHGEALTLGKALAGLNAYSKGVHLGIYHPTPGSQKTHKEHKTGEQVAVPLLGREVPTTKTAQGILAVAKDQPIKPEAVERYLQSSFGDAMESAQTAMEELAKHFRPDELAIQAYGLYERFRPSVPSGKTGWGAKGELDLDLIRSLAK